MAKFRLFDSINNSDPKDLLEIVGNFCDDWRVTYRAFCILAKITQEEKYFKLLERCNPNFPKELIDREFFLIS